MARLPQPQSDEGVWGDVLNEYLRVAHDDGGALKAGSVGEANLDSATISKLNGVSGPAGPQGIQGVAGPQGAQGPAGADSTVPGPQGPQGSQGAQGDSGVPGTTDWAGISGKPVSFAPSAHTHPVSDLADMTTTGRSLAQAADGASARGIIGAGVSNLALGATNVTAAAGNHTHANYLPIKNGTSSIVDSTNDTFTRVDIADDASSTAGWPDRFAFYFNGIRSGYHNEYGELRARPAKVNTVALRVMKWNAVSSVDIFQVSNTDATTLYLAVGPTAIKAAVPITSTADITTTGSVNASNVGNKVTSSATAPSTPSIGDVWVDIS